MKTNPISFPAILAGLLALGAAGCASHRPEANPAGEQVPPGYSLLFYQDFEEATARDDFVFTDAKAWELRLGGAEGTLDLVRQSNYEPPHRSPVNIALIRNWKFRDFVLEVNLLQTGRVYNHQDMCIFFGFQDPAHFYYTHIAVTPDDHAHNIFIVDDAPRTKLADNPDEGVTWGQNVWHTARLERNVQSGTIRVFFDNMETPILQADDTSFGEGYIGFGSFDDDGKVDNVKIWGPSARYAPLAQFPQ